MVNPSHPYISGACTVNPFRRLANVAKSSVGTVRSNVVDEVVGRTDGVPGMTMADSGSNL